MTGWSKLPQAVLTALFPGSEQSTQHVALTVMTILGQTDVLSKQQQEESSSFINLFKA